MMKNEINGQEENLAGKEITSDLKTGQPLESGNTNGEYTSQLKKNKHHLRGVQTMFKNSSSNHQRLSMMADNKAFIMITVNSIIISVAIGLFIGKFVQIPHIIWPTILLVLVNIAAIIYSVLATRPNIPAGTFTREQVDQKTVNLLFFGSYYKMSLQEYEYGIRQ